MNAKLMRGLVLSSVLVSSTQAVVTVIDDGDVGFSRTGGWTIQMLGGRYNGDWEYQNTADGTETATFSFTGLLAGRYVASRASWAQANLSIDAQWDFSDGFGSYQQDQSVLVNHFDTDGGVAFQRFGTGGQYDILTVTDGDLEVVLSDNDDAGFLISDALRLERLRGDAVSVHVIGNDDPGYTEMSGTWASWANDPGDHGVDLRFSTDGAGDAVEVLFTGLTAADYRISVAWTAGANRPTDVKLSYTTNGSSAFINYDQQPGALADDTFEEVAWQDMFTDVPVNDGQLLIRLENVSGGVMVADGFRVERLDPASPFDLDGDGMPNDWETTYGLNPNDPNDAGLDGDLDGLTNLEEFQGGTIPTDDDTDDDDLNDGDEVNVHGTDPVLPDTDGDLLTDGEEAGAGGLGTDPLNVDSDDDGIDDGVEVDESTDPLVPNPRLVQDGNGKEYLVVDNAVFENGGLRKQAFYFEGGAFAGQDEPVTTAWNGDRRWGNDGAATSATWSYDSLANGTYDVFASWNNDAQANVGLAHYTLDGGTTIDVDQSVGAFNTPGSVSLDDGSQLVDFAPLGQVTVTDGILTVTVDDTATGAGVLGGFIFADAIAICEVVPSLTPPTGVMVMMQNGNAEAVLSWGSVASGVYAIDFSENLTSWTEVANGVNSQGTTTTETINVSAVVAPDPVPTLGFFRVRTTSE